MQHASMQCLAVLLTPDATQQTATIAAETADTVSMPVQGRYLTAEEKKEQRQIRNRNSAQISRERKKKEKQSLEIENGRLQQIVTALEVLIKAEAPHITAEKIQEIHARFFRQEVLIPSSAESYLEVTAKSKASTKQEGLAAEASQMSLRSKTKRSLQEDMNDAGKKEAETHVVKKMKVAEGEPPAPQQELKQDKQDKREDSTSGDDDDPTSDDADPQPFCFGFVDSESSPDIGDLDHDNLNLSALSVALYLADDEETGEDEAMAPVPTPTQSILQQAEEAFDREHQAFLREILL